MAKKENKKPLLVSSDHIDKGDLTPSQKEADKLFRDWFFSKKSKYNQVLRVGGCAGAGKSFWIRYLIEHYKFTQDDCMVVAYTGQAVNVLRQSGIMAKTIHSSFMYATEAPLLDNNGKQIYRRGIPLTKTEFVPIPSISSKIKLIIVDESSFVPVSLENVIKRYGTPILEVGDPVQLPPVTGKQCFNMDNLDFLLEGIMRQEADSEIVDIANRLRCDLPIKLSDYGRDVRFLWAQEDDERTFSRFKPFMRAADIIITSTNRQRSIITDLYRSKIVQTESPYPIKGEKLICRRNDWSLTIGPYPLTNGTQGVAVYKVGKSMVDKLTRTYVLDFRPSFISNDMFDGILCDSDYLHKEFGKSEEENFLAKFNIGHKFEFGYAITTHLSQGSQYDKVLFMDSPNRNAEYHMRLRYTAVTRAKKRLVWILPRAIGANGLCWTDLTYSRLGEI